MIVLGIETATAVCAVALVDDDVVRAERRYEIPQAHSEKLMECVDDCLKSAGLILSSIDGIAISIGPGSFTGLRIGLSVAKGLAFAAGKPLVGVPTLEALALQPVRKDIGEADDVIVPMIDARRDEVYTAIFRRHGQECRTTASLASCPVLGSDDNPVRLSPDCSCRRWSE